MARSPLFLNLRNVLATAGVILTGSILLVMVALTTDLGREIVAKRVSRALSSPASQVSIGNIEGQLASDFTIHDVAIADQQGTWLNVDRVHIRWRPLALLRLQLSIDTLDANQVEVLRKPGSGARENSPSNAEPFSLPRLPVSIEVGRASVANLITGAPFLGIPARFSATGKANLAPQALASRSMESGWIGQESLPPVSISLPMTRRYAQASISMSQQMESLRKLPVFPIARRLPSP